MVILQCEGLVVTLPNPELGNSESQNDQVNIKRTMTGGVFSYIKTKRQITLTYSFSLSRPQYRALLNFYNECCAKAIQMFNWKDEYWYGYIVSDSLDVTDSKPGYGACSWGNIVELQFEGLRVN